jgi:hypothetical protein
LTQSLEERFLPADAELQACDTASRLGFQCRAKYEDVTDEIVWLKGHETAGLRQVVRLNSVYDWFSGLSREEILMRPRRLWKLTKWSKGKVTGKGVFSNYQDSGVEFNGCGLAGLLIMQEISSISPLNFPTPELLGGGVLLSS